MADLASDLARQLSVRKERIAAAIGALLVVMGAIVTFSDSEFIWTSAMLVGGVQAAVAAFAMRKKLRIRRLVARGATEWPCDACGQSNPIADGFTCSRCRVCCVTITGEAPRS